LNSYLYSATPLILLRQVRKRLNTGSSNQPCKIRNMVKQVNERHYTAYGLCLQVNSSIPGLVTTPPPAEEAVDVRVTLGAFPDMILPLLASESVNYYISPWCNRAGDPHLIIDTLATESYFYFKYDDGVQFVCARAATEVWGTWPENLSMEDATLYLLGPILGFILRLRGVTCLHASGIAVGEQAFAIVGMSGAGKSTTAAALAARGYSVVSDDILPLAKVGQTFQAIPGYPRLRLWPHAVEALYGVPDAQPLLTPKGTKRYLDLTNSVYTFQSTPVPIRAIYLLSPRSENPAAPFIEPEPLQQGLFALAANTYRNELLDKSMRQQEFRVLSRLVTHIPLRRVTPYTDIAKLPQLCDLILEDFQALASKPLYLPSERSKLH
jgi:hypothetical protein